MRLWEMSHVIRRSPLHQIWHDKRLLLLKPQKIVYLKISWLVQVDAIYSSYTKQGIIHKGILGKIISVGIPETAASHIHAFPALLTNNYLHYKLVSFQLKGYSGEQSVTISRLRQRFWTYSSLHSWDHRQFPLSRLKYSLCGKYVPKDGQIMYPEWDLSLPKGGICSNGKKF